MGCNQKGGGNLAFRSQKRYISLVKSTSLKENCSLFNLIEEQLDAKLYAENVRQLMSKALGIPACKLTSEDVQNLRQNILESRKTKIIEENGNEQKVK